MYQLSEEHIMLRNMVRDLAADKVAPRAAEIDEQDEFPWDLKELFAANDLLALPFPEKYGGTGSDSLMFCLAMEEIARVSASASMVPGDHALGSYPLVIGCGAEQRERFFPAP